MKKFESIFKQTLEQQDTGIKTPVVHAIKDFFEGMSLLTQPKKTSWLLLRQKGTRLRTKTELLLRKIWSIVLLWKRDSRWSRKNMRKRGSNTWRKSGRPKKGSKNMSRRWIWSSKRKRRRCLEIGFKLTKNMRKRCKISGVITNSRGNTPTALRLQLNPSTRTPSTGKEPLSSEKAILD